MLESIIELLDTFHLTDDRQFISTAGDIETLRQRFIRVCAIERQIELELNMIWFSGCAVLFCT